MGAILNRITITATLPLVSFGVFISPCLASEFNTAFIHGTTVTPSIFNSETRYPAGLYYADVSLNRSRTARVSLLVSTEDEKDNQLCLSSEWLKNAGIVFKPEIYLDTFNKDRNCYQLGRKSNTEINFDLSNQTLDFVIPQAWLADKNDAVRWDYGINGLRLTYNGNFNKNIP